MILKVIKKVEYVLDPKEFHEEKSKVQRRGDYIEDNSKSFIRDLELGHLDRYNRSFVAYKEGILCGHSRDEATLRDHVNFVLCTPNVSLYRVERNEGF
ncbi:MAG: hypothetical protein Q7S27_05835 [Nanoarchaeota archaeon]|nr:hypothetical protein [Nanoarchaeota archaeon]